jgi:hypothetical protein
MDVEGSCCYLNLSLHIYICREKPKRKKGLSQYLASSPKLTIKHYIYHLVYKASNEYKVSSSYTTFDREYICNFY